MKKPTTQMILFFIGLAVVLFLLGFLVKEGFRDINLDTRKEFQKETEDRGIELTSMTDECGARSSCGSCLEPKRILSEESISAAECAKKPSAYFDAAKSKCISYRYGNCGWCPNAEGAGKGKCVPKIVSSSTGGAPAYPLVPRAKGENDSVAVGAPIYKCPLSEFVSQPEMCPEFSCATIKDCGDCAASFACGWCKKTSTCVARKTRGGDVAVEKDGVSVCPAEAGVQQFMTTPGGCPAKACGEIADCAKCAATDGCGYCAAKSKCLKIEAGGGLPDEKIEKCVSDGGEAVDPLTAPTQCPGAAPGTFTADMSSFKPSDLQLAMIQGDMLGLAGPGEKVVQSVDNLGFGAVTPPKGKTDVGAPGISRPLGGSWERPTVPAASGLSGLQGGPFEGYVKMLVKSELAAQGVPTAEPFQVGDVVQNTTQYFKAEGEKLADEYDPAAKTRRR